MVNIKPVPDMNEHIPYSELEDWITFTKGYKKIGSFKTEVNSINNNSEKFNLYKIQNGKGIPILISAGVHGYEVSGVHTIMKFLNEDASKYFNKFEFTVFPCVNPWGFDKAVHENWQYQNDTEMGLNLNREWTEKSKAVEINLIKPHLKNYAVHLDLHETWSTYTDKRDKALNEISPDEFFLWETCEDKKLIIGPKIIEAVEKEGIIVCKCPKIYDDTNINGVISYPEGSGTECYIKSDTAVSFDAYTNKKHAPQTFTIETPLFESLKYRIRANIITIEATLEELLKRTSS